MNKLASILRAVGSANSKGGQDTELAHVNPAEKRLLALLGGSGRRDEDTGLLHFDDDNGDGGGGYGGDNGSGGVSGFGDESGSGTAADNSVDGGMGGPGGADTGFGSSGFDTEDAAYAASVQNALDNPTQEGFGTDEGLGASESATPGQGLGTWDFSWGLSPADQATHNANVNQSISNTLGYDIGQNFGGPGGMADMLGLNEQAKADARAAALANEQGRQNMDIDEQNIGYSRGANFAAPGANQYGFTQDQVSKANADYNAMGWQGQLSGNPWGYTDLGGKDQTNWGAIGSDVANVVNNPITAGIATAAGVGPAYGLVSAGLNAARGNYGPAVNQLGNMLGPGYGVGLSALNSLASGTPGNFLGGVATNALNSYAPGLGNIAQATGLTGYASRGVNEAFQNSLEGPGLTGTNEDGTMMALSSEGLGSPDSGADGGYSTADSGGFNTAGVSAPVFASGGAGFTGFGGGGDGGFSGYDFVGSKKKSRYAQPGYLAAMLGGENAV
jgi:hypothetical protein